MATTRRLNELNRARGTGGKSWQTGDYVGRRSRRSSERRDDGAELIVCLTILAILAIAFFGA